MTSRSRRCLAGLLWVAGISIMAWPLAGCSPRMTPMTPDESQRVDKITQRMSTRCIGRHQVDLPASFVLNSEAVATVNGVVIKIAPMPRQQYDWLLQGRTRTLQNEKILGEGTPSLIATHPLADGAGVIFNRSENRMSPVIRTFELLAWKEGYRILMTVNARDMTNARRLNASDTRQTNVDEKLAILLDVYSRTHVRRDDQIPATQGFCVANGFVEGPPVEEEESFVPYHLDGTPDVHFYISAIKEGIKASKSLLQRSGNVEREMLASGTQTLRKGSVRYQDVDYEEWLMKGPTPARVPGTMFAMLGNETRPGLAHPFIRIELFNGFRIPAPERSMEESAQLKDLERATLSEAEAIAVWDKVTATVRPRPGSY